MCTKKNILIFLAGAEAFHTIAKLGLYFSGLLPLPLFGIVWTPHMVLGAAVIHAIITVVLLWLACKVDRHCVDNKYQPNANRPYDNRPHDNRPNF